MKQQGKVVFPTDAKSLPEPHEMDVANILAHHYRCTVEFLLPTGGYKAKTPDIVMNGVTWEIKSPTGKSRTTISNQFEGRKQSRNLIIDGCRTRLDDVRIQTCIKQEMAKRNRIRRVLFITKHRRVVEM